MATQLLTDVKLYAGAYDFSTDMNALALTYSAEMLDETCFGDSTRINKAGLKSVVASFEGLWDAAAADDPDRVLFDTVGTSSVPVTIAPLTGADGEVAYIFRSIQSAYTPGAQVGELFAFSVSMEGSDGAPLVRSTVLHPATARTATSTGTARQLGALSASQTLYATLHVIAASGTNPTLDVVVQSDNASNFPSPLSQITFAQRTAIGSEWKSLAGANTDDWFRISYTIGGTGPSFTFVVAVGIA